MEDTLTNVFDEVMEREGRTLTTYTDRTEARAFFRRNSDGTDSRDTVIMFYGKEAPVRQGTLFSLDDGIYIALNREHAEGSVYWKSAVEKTNGTITLNDLSVMDIPIFGETLKSTLALRDTHLSIVDGYTTFITEDSPKSRMLKINGTFNEWGRTWRIEQVYLRDGICHITAKVSVDEVVTYDYRLELSPLSVLNVMPGCTAEITATAYINDVGVTDAEIIYRSSDDTLATIDAEGGITYLADGRVYFTAIWVGHEDLVKTTELVNIISSPVDETVALHVDTVAEIYNGFEEEVGYYVTRGGVRVTDIHITFTIENVSTTAVYAKNVRIVSQTDSIVTVMSDDSRLIDQIFELIGRNTEHNLEDRQTIKIKSMF